MRSAQSQTKFYSIVQPRPCSDRPQNAYNELVTHHIFTRPAQFWGTNEEGKGREILWRRRWLPCHACVRAPRLLVSFNPSFLPKDSRSPPLSLTTQENCRWRRSRHHEWKEVVVAQITVGGSTGLCNVVFFRGTRVGYKQVSYGRYMGTWCKTGC